MTAPVLPSPKKQDVSNLASRKFNSISTPPIKDSVSQKGEAEQYEYNSKAYVAQFKITNGLGTI